MHRTDRGPLWKTNTVDTKLRHGCIIVSGIGCALFCDQVMQLEHHFVRVSDDAWGGFCGTYGFLGNDVKLLSQLNQSAGIRRGAVGSLVVGYCEVKDKQSAQATGVPQKLDP